MRKKKILWYYGFYLFEDKIHDMNKNHCSNLHTYTEAKGVFILYEEQKPIKTDKILDLKKSKDNSTGASNGGHNTA